MNFVKQFGIDDALDRLHAKYGDDWDIEAEVKHRFKFKRQPQYLEDGGF